jgi:hypothetical protein
MYTSSTEVIAEERRRRLVEEAAGQRLFRDARPARMRRRRRARSESGVLDTATIAGLTPTFDCTA